MDPCFFPAGGEIFFFSMTTGSLLAPFFLAADFLSTGTSSTSSSEQLTSSITRMESELKNERNYVWRIEFEFRIELTDETIIIFECFCDHFLDFATFLLLLCAIRIAMDLFSVHGLGRTIFRWRCVFFFLFDIFLFLFRFHRLFRCGGLLLIWRWITYLHDARTICRNLFILRLHRRFLRFLVCWRMFGLRSTRNWVVVALR